MNHLDILIVDDDPADIAILTEFLEEGPFTCTISEAHDGHAGLDALANGPRPDLVILDLNMPRMGGQEMLKRLRADPDLGDLPVLVLTTSDRDEDIEATFTDRANAFVTKPDDVDGFEAFLQLVDDFAKAYIWAKAE